MSKNDDKRKPPPRQEVLPPERVKTNVPVIRPHQPQGIIESVGSGFMSRIRRGSVDRHNELLESQLKNIRLNTDIANAIVDNLIAWDDVFHIDQILDARHRQREYNALVARAKEENELTRLKHETRELEMRTRELDQLAWEQQRDHESRRAGAAAQEQKQRYESRRAEEEAKARYIAARRDRRMAEALEEIIISTRKAIEQAKDAEEKYKLAARMQVLRGAQQAAEADAKKASLELLDKVVAELTNLQDVAIDRKNKDDAGFYAIVLATIKKVREGS